jgi:hypothetical protein
VGGFFALLRMTGGRGFFAAREYKLYPTREVEK